MVLTTIVSASYQNLQKKMAGKKISRANFTVTKDSRVCYQHFERHYYERDASNTREVQVGGGCCPKNPGLFMMQTLDQP